MAWRSADMKALERARISGIGWAVWVKTGGKWYVAATRENTFAIWPCRRRARNYAYVMRDRGFTTRIRKAVRACNDL